MSVWQYRGTIKRWIDADTLDTALDLGFHVYHTQRLRLLASFGGVDAPEVNSTDPGQRLLAMMATERCNELAPPGCEVILRTQKAPVERDGFGRFLAEVLLPDGRSVGDVLIAEGLAVIWRRAARQ